MTVDPRWSIYLGLFLSILGYLAGVGALLTDAGLEAHTVKVVMAIIMIIFGIGNSVNSFLAGIPSKNNTTGFIVKGPPPPAA